MPNARMLDMVRQAGNKNTLWMIGLIMLMLALSPGWAAAGSFRVSPIKVYFEPGITSTTVKVTNDDKENLKLELDIKQWRQDGATGKDLLTDTKDMIFFPRMLEIEPGKEKIIRVGFRGKPSPGEQTYRLFVKELPVIKPGETALKFALRVGVPVFVKPLQAKSELSVEHAEVSGGALHVRVKNSGNSHAVVKKVLVSGTDAKGRDSLQAETGGWYVLAGATREFIVDLPEKDCRKTSRIRIDVQEEGNSTTSDIHPKANQCKADKG